TIGRKFKKRLRFLSPQVVGVQTVAFKIENRPALPVEHAAIISHPTQPGLRLPGTPIRLRKAGVSERTILPSFQIQPMKLDRPIFVTVGDQAPAVLAQTGNKIIQRITRFTPLS